MGKKNKFEDRDFYSPGSKNYKEVQKLLKRYGVEGYKSAHPDGRTGPGRSVDMVRTQLSNKMMNDYHTNESIQNAARAGNKGAKKIAKKGISEKNIGKAWNTYKDLKKEYVGGGGMDGPENISGLTYETGKALDKSYEDRFSSKSDKPEIDGTEGLEYYNDDPADNEDREPTDLELSKERTDAYERRMAPEYFKPEAGLNKRKFNDVEDEDDQDKAATFRDNFRNKLLA